MAANVMNIDLVHKGLLSAFINPSQMNDFIVVLEQIDISDLCFESCFF